MKAGEAIPPRQDRRGRPRTGNLPVMLRLSPRTAEALRTKAAKDEREISVTAERILRKALGLEDDAADAGSQKLHPKE